MPIGPDSDYQAQEDAFTLLRAKEIEEDAGRVSAAKSFAVDKSEQFAQMARDMPSAKVKAVNNSVANSKMRPK